MWATARTAPPFAQGQNLAAQLEKAGIDYHYTESTGGHTRANWRIYLNEFAPSLFKWGV